MIKFRKLAASAIDATEVDNAALCKQHFDSFDDLTY
jgi:hypothetical protein